MQPVTVSVLMPAWNVEQWIDDAIESVLDQRVQYLELIVIDDCSSDATRDGALVWSCGASRPVLVTPKFDERKGIAAALNYGASLARGEYVMFMGADDYIPPSFLQNAVECFDMHPEATVVCPPIHEFEHSIAEPTGIWTPELDLSRLHVENLIPAHSVWRRALWDAIPWPGGFEKTGAEDWAWWVLLNRAGLLKPVRMTSPYYHRSRPDGVTQSLTAHNLPEIRRKILALHETGKAA